MPGPTAFELPTPDFKVHMDWLSSGRLFVYPGNTCLPYCTPDRRAAALGVYMTRYANDSYSLKLSPGTEHWIDIEEPKLVDGAGYVIEGADNAQTTAIRLARNLGMNVHRALTHAAWSETFHYHILRHGTPYGDRFQVIAEPAATFPTVTAAITQHPDSVFVYPHNKQQPAPAEGILLIPLESNNLYRIEVLDSTWKTLGMSRDDPEPATYRDEWSGTLKDATHRAVDLAVRIGQQTWPSRSTDTNAPGARRPWGPTDTLLEMVAKARNKEADAWGEVASRSLPECI